MRKIGISTIALSTFLAFAVQDFAHSQQVSTIEIAAPKQLGPDPGKKLSAAEQRNLFLSRTERIRSHHRPVPLKAAIAPFSVMLAMRRVDIMPRSLEAQLQNEMNIIRQTSVTGSARIDYEYASPISEPTVASRGDEVLVTGNWYAALSVDGGTTFQAVDPFALFRRANSDQEFCCDQVAAYDRDTDAIFWLMQGTIDEKFKGNQFTLFIAKGQTDIRNQSWFYVELPSTKLLRREGRWFDFPDVAFSATHIYITSNIFTTTDNAWDGAVVMRMDKKQLASYQAAPAGIAVLQTGSLRLSRGAGDTMYWVGHEGQSRAMVWNWGDQQQVPQGPIAVETETWQAPDADAVKAATAPNGRPWLKRLDGRVTAAWTAQGHFGFAWGAGSDNRFKYPHVRVAVVPHHDISSAAAGSIRPQFQPHIWNNTFAIAYPSAAPNREGMVGFSVAYGGPKNFPGYAVGFFKDGVSVPPTLTRIREGRNTPMCPRRDGTKDFECGVWGDYFALSPHGSVPNSWVTVGFTVQNADHEKVKVESEFVWFDRRR